MVKQAQPGDYGMLYFIAEAARVHLSEYRLALTLELERGLAQDILQAA